MVLRLLAFVATIVFVAESTATTSKLGPVAVTETTIDSQGSVRYTVTSDLTATTPGLTFWQFEIVRFYADGARIVSLQEQDFLETTVLGCVGVGSMLDPNVSRPSPVSEHAHVPKDLGRTDLPTAVGVRPTAVLLSDGSIFGDRTRIASVIRRREVLLRELNHWVRRMQQTQNDFPGLLGLRYLAEGLSDPQTEQVTDVRATFSRLVATLAWGMEGGEIAPERLSGIIRAERQLADLLREQLRVSASR